MLPRICSLSFPVTQTHVRQKGSVDCIGYGDEVFQNHKQMDAAEVREGQDARRNVLADI